MSKKMLKRSLALGALMAFVITGQAWAANITNQTEADKYSGKNGVVNIDGAVYADTSNIKLYGTSDTVFNITGGSDFVGDMVGVGSAYTFDKQYVRTEIDNAKELHIFGEYAVCAGEDASNGLRKGEVLLGSNIENINIYCTKKRGLGVLVGGKGGLLQVEGDYVTVNGVEGAIGGIYGNAEGNAQFGTSDKNLKELSINGFDSNAVYSSGNSTISILSEKFNVNTNGVGLHVNRGNIRVGSENNRATDIVIKSKAEAIKGTNSDHNNSEISLYSKRINIQSLTDGKEAIFAYNKHNNDSGTAININASEELNIIGNIKSEDVNSVVNINDGVDSALVTIDGDVTADAGTINLNLGNTGSTLTSTITDNANGVNLNLNKGTWNVTGASTLNKLQSNNGYISFASDSAVAANIQNASGSVLLTETGKTADDYNTSEQLSKIANKLYVSKDASESLEAKVIMPAGVVRGVTTGVVTYADTDSDNLLNGTVAKEDISESVNTTNSGIAEMHSIALMAWRAENNDMHKRLGELRDANGEHGAWARMTRGESEYESVKNQYNAYQLGYDQKAGDWTVGAAVTYTEGETSFAEGNGENDHTGLAVYGSKLNGDGSYLDLIAKYAKLDHEYTVSGGIGSGEYDTDGFALSAEYGKRFEQGNGLWIEPQVELTYGLVDSVDFAAENGRVSLDDMNSLVGRVGFRAGKNVKDGNVYVRASYLYDFEGETDIAFTDGVDTRSFKQDLGGGWWEFGIGTNINLSKATYIYADVEHACGGEVDTDWKWNLGVRYSF